VAHAYGGTLRPERNWSSRSYPEGTYEHLGVRDDEGHCETTISTKVGYCGQEIEITTASIELATKVAELVRSHYAKG
jgi:hypothetical protein